MTIKTSTRILTISHFHWRLLLPLTGSGTLFKSPSPVLTRIHVGWVSRCPTLLRLPAIGLRSLQLGFCRPCGNLGQLCRECFQAGEATWITVLCYLSGFLAPGFWTRTSTKKMWVLLLLLFFLTTIYYKPVVYSQRGTYWIFQSIMFPCLLLSPLYLLTLWKKNGSSFIHSFILSFIPSRDTEWFIWIRYHINTTLPILPFQHWVLSLPYSGGKLVSEALNNLSQITMLMKERAGIKCSRANMPTEVPQQESRREVKPSSGVPLWVGYIHIYLLCHHGQGT